MSFGLTNAPIAFMDIMNRVFRTYMHSFVVAFINEILVYLKKEDEHMKDLNIVLERMKEHVYMPN